MMDAIMTVKNIMDRYGCSRQTAVRYIQSMEHMEKPYAVRVAVLEQWERDRTVRPPEAVRRDMIRERIKRRLA